MKTKIFAFALSMFLAVPVIAQEADEQPNDVDESADRITEQLTRALALSEDQREEVYELTVEMLEEKHEDDESRGEVMAKYDEEMAEILNDEQYAQYMEGEDRKSMMMVEKHKAKKKAAGY